jgi:cell filamentation protein
VTFDPFGDFEARGYLRNIEGEKDPDIVRRLEHLSFTTGLDEAFQKLSRNTTLSYEDVLRTHKILFEAVYPWAGQDRLTTAPDLAVSKGSVLFAYPQDIRRSVRIRPAKGAGQDLHEVKARPCHGLSCVRPSLSGWQRSDDHGCSFCAQRAGFSIDWSATGKSDYLDALTRELDDPSKGHLDAYLKPFMRTAVASSLLVARVAAAPGIDGNAEDNIVLGSISEPELQVRYRQQELKRKSTEQ